MYHLCVALYQYETEINNLKLELERMASRLAEEEAAAEAALSEMKLKVDEKEQQLKTQQEDKDQQIRDVISRWEVTSGHWPLWGHIRSLTPNLRIGLYEIFPKLKWLQGQDSILPLTRCRLVLTPFNLMISGHLRSLNSNLRFVCLLTWRFSFSVQYVSPRMRCVLIPLPQIVEVSDPIWPNPLNMH